MMRAIMLATLLALPAAASAQDDTVASKPPAKIRNVTLGAGEQCPTATGDEIVVCQTVEEPLRIPKALRRLAPSAANRTWASRVESFEDVGREGGGVPNSCSPTGDAGQTGCTQALIRQWQAEQRAAQGNGPRLP